MHPIACRSLRRSSCLGSFFRLPRPSATKPFGKVLFHPTQNRCHWPFQCQPRYVSSTTPTTKAETIVHVDNGDDEEDTFDEIVLFQRKTNSHKMILLMRSGFLCSTVHTGYWIWYNIDFIPLVNASPAEYLHVDPNLGLFGLSMAVLINAIFAVYPKRFISRVAYRQHSQEIVVYTHRLPLMRPSLSPRRFPVGKEGSKSYFRLDAGGDHARIIIHDLQGGIQHYRGHIPIGVSWPRYTMAIQSAEDVVQPDLLVEALLTPEEFSLTRTSTANGEDIEEDIDVVVPLPRRKAYPRRRKARRNSKRKGG